MHRAELERLLNDIESDRVECTISLTDIDKFSEAICAFANDMPNSGSPSASARFAALFRRSKGLDPTLPGIHDR
jgi:predicted HTH transcriptional regulator